MSFSGAPVPSRLQIWPNPRHPELAMARLFRRCEGERHGGKVRDVGLFRTIFFALREHGHRGTIRNKEARHCSSAMETVVFDTDETFLVRP
jgi:hypothetical protein